jgi:hypothetical protein
MHFATFIYGSQSDSPEADHIRALGKSNYGRNDAPATIISASARHTTLRIATNARESGASPRVNRSSHLSIPVHTLGWLALPVFASGMAFSTGIPLAE